MHIGAAQPQHPNALQRGVQIHSRHFAHTSSAVRDDFTFTHTLTWRYIQRPQPSRPLKRQTTVLITSQNRGVVLYLPCFFPFNIRKWPFSDAKELHSVYVVNFLEVLKTEATLFFGGEKKKREKFKHAHDSCIYTVLNQK